MTHCKLCDGLGWFFTLNKDGLCANCHRMTTLEVSLRKRTLEDASLRAETTLNPASKITNLDIVEENLKVLSNLENKGIPTIETSPTGMLHETRSRRKEIIIETAMSEFKSILKRSSELPSLQDRRKLLSGFLLKLDEYKKKSGELWFIEDLEDPVRKALHQIQLNELLEKAGVLETDGDTAGALTIYTEAWAFIRKASIPEETMTAQTAKLNSKIKKLGGKPPRAGSSA